MARNDRLARVLQLADLLVRSRRGVVLSQIAAERGWNLRSLYRDIDLMHGAGWPVQHDEGRYRLMEGWTSALQLGIDPEELVALFAARQLAAGFGGTSVERSLERLWNKLVHAGPRRGALLPTEAPWFTVRSPLSIDYPAHRKTIATIERGLRDHLTLSCRYVDSHGTLTARVVEPAELHWDPRLETLYLIGWCRLRGDVRIFAVHRFRLVAASRERFAPRPGVSSRAALRSAFRVWREKNVEHVVVDFAAEVAREIIERRWHPSQETERLSGGGVRVRLEVAGLAEIERWILGYGAASTAVAPARLVDAIRAQLDVAREKYGEAGARRAKNA